MSAPSATIATNATEQFSVAVQNASNSSANWQVNSVPGGSPSVGMIDATGLYTAPTSVPAPSPVVTVSAVLVTDTTKSGSAAITVMAVLPANFGVFSWRNDNTLSGVNNQETRLTPAAVPGGHFGKVFSCAVDGYVYAQPLYVANLSITGKGLHNVVFVATEHDSVYAFDADANPCQTLWKTSFLATGVTTVPSGDVGGTDIVPEIGITGTPAIDPNSKTLYVVVKTKENGGYAQRLHALDLLTGGEKFGGPALIQASVSGTGDGNTGTGHVPFDPLRENQQAALTLTGGKLYVAFGGHGNSDPFHGWIFAYNATALNQSPVVFNATPNGSHGGIWQSGAAPSADSNGNIFFATGHGTFDVSNPVAAPHDSFGQTLLRFDPVSPAVTDFFTPSNQILLTSNQQDFGSSGVLLLPDSAGSPQNPHLAVTGSEASVLYLVNRDNMGRFTLGGPDKVVHQTSLGTLAGGVFGTPAYWKAVNSLYVGASGDRLKSFSLVNGNFSDAIISQSATAFAFPGTSPVISWNGSNSNSGIVWALDASGFAGSQPAVLHAYDAANLATQLYDSSQKSGDAAGAAVKFTVPTVANGKVYVGTQTELSVYALLP